MEDAPNPPIATPYFNHENEKEEFEIMTEKNLSLEKIMNHIY